jgi:UDP-hydrolysing UDP-N-acetyl-D-glucosamine 2-epimerase
MRTICTVVNSRANYARIKSVLAAISESSDLDLKLIVGASALLWRFGDIRGAMENDGFKPNASVYSIVEGETPTTMAKSTGLGILEMATQFENLDPDVVLTVADRFETIATAIAGAYMNIPVAHTQGGEVTGSIDESVRHAVTKLSHIHFPATEQAGDYIIRMGEDPASVHVTGCPSIDLIANLDLSLPDDIFKRYGGAGATLHPGPPYLVVLQHPVTTEYGSGIAQISQTLEAVRRIGMQTAWFWPNVDAGSDDIAKGLRSFREAHSPDWLHFYRNFAAEDFARLIANADCFIGNSSSALREGAFLGVPSVNIGSRQRGRERSENVKDAWYDADEIEAAIRRQLEHGKYARSLRFGGGDAGKKIAKLLANEDVSVQKTLTYTPR